LRPRGETHLQPTKATDDPAAIGPVDFVLFCVKLWDIESAGERIKPLVGPETAVITLQNGIDAHERLGDYRARGLVAPLDASLVDADDPSPRGVPSTNAF